MKKRFVTIFISSFELLLAAALWGFGFVAVVWSLKVWSPPQLVFLRFFIGAAAGLALSLIFTRVNQSEWWRLLRLSFLPALFLFLMLIAQTHGLLYTTATKSGFITILYVVLVPLLDGLLGGRKVSLVLWLCVGASLIGVAMIVDLSLPLTWNYGDLLTLACAFAASVQILLVDRVSHQIHTPFLFNNLQSLWCCAFAAPLLGRPYYALFHFRLGYPLLGLLAISFGGTMIAFFLQVKAQKVLSPTVSSIFFLLESPFALIFAFTLLGEQLNSRQLWGAVLILLSALLATVYEARMRRRA